MRYEVLVSPNATPEEQHREQCINRWEQLTEYRRRYRHVTLDGFDQQLPEQKAAVEAVRRYGRAMTTNIQRGSGILLIGPTGTGKSHLAATLARHAVFLGHTVQWVDGVEVSAGEVQFENADVLLLEDPCLTNDPLRWEGLRRVYSLVNKQYRQQSPVWVTCNVADRAELRELCGPQLSDRFLDDSQVVRCHWPSHRQPR